MITISTLSFYFLLEVIAILLVLLIIAGWRLRKVSGGSGHKLIEANEGHPPPGLYLDREAAKTQTFVASLQGKPECEPADPALRSSLGVRARLLRHESVLARTPMGERDPGGWSLLARDVSRLLSAEGYVRKAKADQIHGEDSQTSVVLAKQQEQTIMHLREYIQELLEALGHQPSPETDIEDRFNELDRVNEELKLCVAILEDENEFLRDQIAALLKLMPTENDAVPSKLSISAG
ncbi:MAG TPA: hypothetical protein VLA26_05065 [Gammaproteobacteria bacterium]|nr:hypothetical protein [Gammaproteobacteria bacterium]